MKENVFFILVDCLRADKCYGNNRTAKTPNIDSLIQKGTFFSKTIASTTTTTPSIASLFTGLYPPAHGIRALRGYKLADNIKTLAEVFKENGYNTYAEVTGPLVSYTGLDRGFDRYSFREKKGVERELFIGEWGDVFIEKIRSSKFKEPWFIFLHLWELHEPRYIAKEFNNNKYGRNKYERALSGLDARLGELFKHVDFNTTTVILHGDHGEKIIETMFDEHIYQLKKRIKGIMWYIVTEVFKKTYKLFRISYGKIPSFASRDCIPKKPTFKKEIGHGFLLYDYAVTTPLIITGNNGKFTGNRFISTQVRQIDIFPTLVDALNLNYSNNNPTIHGQSIMPLIEGKDFDALPAYVETWGRFFVTKRYWKAGLRTAKYKFIKTVYNTKTYEELYDLEADNLERKNIIKFQPQIANVLRKQLLDIRKDDTEEIKLVGQRMTEAEERLLTERLKDLGYVD